MKKSGIYISVAVFIALVLYFLFFRTTEIKDFSAIQKSGRITVVTDSSSMGFSVSKEGVSGYNYEIIKAFANKYGLELIISQSNNTENGIDELLSGEAQVLVHYIPSNKENLQRLLLTKPILNTALVLVQKTDSTNIHSQLEMSGDTVFVAEGSVFIPRIKNLAEEISSEIKIVELKNKSLEQMVEMVARGQIKNTVCPEQLAIIYTSRFGNLNISLPVGFQQEYAWAVHPLSIALGDTLNNFLNEYIGSSEYWEMFLKYQ